MRGKESNGLNLKEVISYSLLPFGMATIFSVTSTALNMYFTDILGLSMGMVSIIMFVSKIWDAFNDPIMGSIVDKTKTRFGKCRPYIFWMSLPLAAALALLFAPIDFGASGNFVYAFIAYILFYTVNTSVDIPNQGLPSLIFPEEKQRVKAIAVSNILGSLGSILPSVLFFTIAGLWGRENEKQGYFLSAVIFAVMAGLPMFISAFGFKEKVKIPQEKTAFREAFKIVYKDKNFVCLVIAFIFSQAAFIGSIYLPYFTKWNCAGVIPVDELCLWIKNTFGISISLTSEDLLTPVIQIGSGIAFIVSTALVPPLLKKMDKKTLWIWVSVLGVAANIACYIIGVWIFPYNTVTGLIVYTVMRFFASFPNGMTTVLATAMFSDMIESFEVRTGKRLEGTVFSIRSLVNKTALSVFNWFVLSVISWFGYDAKVMMMLTDNLSKPLITSTTQAVIYNGVNYTTLLNVIFFMLTAFSAIGLFLQTVPMFFYKVNEKEQNEKLRIYREAQEKTVLEESEVS